MVRRRECSDWLRDGLLMAWPYHTRRWRRERELQLARSPVCEICSSCSDLEVHHLRPLSRAERDRRDDDAAFPGPDGLQTLCRPCHSRVTAGASDTLATKAAGWRRFIDGG
ncbi:MAG: HNH endonuclease [Gemmatimonadetes bacterium]|nr:HNH endonuclease [Gemmatimonadota bacterium]